MEGLWRDCGAGWREVEGVDGGGRGGGRGRGVEGRSTHFDAYNYII